MNLIQICFLIWCLVISVPAMFFDLSQQREKCIIEEIPEDTLVTGYILLEHWDKKQERSPHLGLTVTIKDPNLEVLLMKKIGKYGKFTFTSHSSGQHFVCVKSNTTRFSVFADELLKVHLDVQMVEHTIDPTAVKTKDTIESLEFKMRHLIAQMQFISKQQDFEREREETFRQMSEETNGNVLWWAIIQTSLLLTVGFWQIRSLKNFFIEKKLV
ncbi:transmembrane emp24 domain-containing protein 11 [Clarias gariepinus]|uniref:transmembrane emp24 domain-containing protein 11 n=1 Tax=Clarias gariepinus TaxID=13013 RepID=UPI00234D44A3|nr:transmembrane emp24 domain-containing protein 11 [Clarias gariepinus]